MTDPERKLKDRFGDRLIEGEPLSEHTSFKIGGPAEFFLEAGTIKDFLDAISIARDGRIAYFILGGGSNILVGDNGIPGLVIKNVCDGYLIDNDDIAAQSGMELNRLVDISCENSLSGLEFAAGIWGTVGGAVCGNAGAFGGSISDVLARAVVITVQDRIESVGKDHFGFEYRHSRIKSPAAGETVLSVSLRMRKGDRAAIKSKIDEHRHIRSQKHPLDLPSAGSFFKNLKNPAIEGREVAAGWYLDRVGARDFRVGDAGVFHKHANIFVNHGKALAADVITMASELKKMVLERFSVDLRMEVRPVGDFGDCQELLNTITN